jgi:uncharacterized membrane protein YdjX (TVP38/TMEM64 family)
VTQRARVALLAAVLVAAFAAFWVFDVVDQEDIEAIVEPFGPVAPLAYVVVAGLLGVALVPGALLAGAAGLLFGAAAGTVVTLASSVLSAVIALLIGRRAAGPPPERFSGLAALAERHGFTAVVVQRLTPAIPDAPASYVFGALGVRVWQIALGTLVGAAPRAFSYASIGASLDDPDSTLAIAGVVVLVVTAIVGTELARRMISRRG